jgi:hypothetical protein
VAPV